MPNDAAIELKRALLEILAPLREAARDPRLLEEWLATLGYTHRIGRDPLLAQIASEAEALGQSLEALGDASLDSWTALSDLLDRGRGLKRIYDGVKQFAADASRAQIAATLPDELVSSLLAIWLRRKHPLVFRTAATFGVISASETATPESALELNDVIERYQRSLDRFDLSAFGALLSDPGTSLAGRYLPNGLSLASDTGVASARVFPVLGLLANALGLSWRTVNHPGAPLPPTVGSDDGPIEELPLPSLEDPEQVFPPFPPPPTAAYFTTTVPTFVVRLAGAGASEATLEVRASSAEHPGGFSGYLVTPTGNFQTSETRGPWTLTLTAQGALPTLGITSNGVDLAPGSQPVAGGRASLSLRRQQAQTAPFVAGNPRGTRLELGTLEADAAILFDTARRALVLSVGTPSATLVIAPAEGDGFLAEILPEDGLSATFSLALTWASDAGLSLSGSGGLAVTVPVSLSLGGIGLTELHLALRAANAGLIAEISGTLNAKLGPVKALVEGVGLSAALNGSSGGNLGVADLDVGFKGPRGVGLSVDAGMLTGGGMLRYDAAQATYGGVLQLSLRNSLTLTAYGLITTRLPDGRPGFSLLIFITAEGFKPIPLGFGFVLQAVGGVLGVHRTVDTLALQAGLRTNTLGALLFPRDPVANAPTILQALATVFPPQRGSYLLGLLARITWFTPTLVQLELALLLEVGVRTRLVLLGRVSALLPTRDNDLLRLQLDSVGVLDFDAGTVEADAVLVDSRLVHQFPITGAAALRARWPSAGAAADVSGAHFALAIGGFNPRYAPPVGFPALERVALALTKGKNPQLVCEAYFALTANTVQFGARAWLYAEAAGFNVRGELGFDALVTLRPPHFVVDFRAAMQVRRGSHNICKVVVEGTLEGPLPLRVVARARIEILCLSVTLQLRYTLAAGASGSVRISVDLEGEVRKALAEPGNWRTRLTPGQSHGVVLRAGGSVGVLDPLGQVVVTQSVAPLNTGRAVTQYAGQAVVGATRFAVSGALNTQAGVSEAGAFAPAQYFELSDDEKLVAPSFERRDAGVAFGDGQATYAAGRVVGAPLKYASVTFPPVSPSTTAAAASTASTASAAANELETIDAQRSTTPYVLPAAALGAQRASGAAGRAPIRRVGRARFRYEPGRGAATVKAVEWRLVSAKDSKVAAPVTIPQAWSEQREALNRLNRAGARWTMIPVYEVAP